LADQLHHSHVIRDGASKQQEQLYAGVLALNATQEEKRPGRESGLAFWLKLSAGGQLDGYFEYVELVVVAGASFF
jgi:hypothetical protein